MSFARGTTWILINPQKFVRECLIENYEDMGIASFWVYEDAQLEIRGGSNINNLAELNPLSTFFFIDTQSTAHKFAKLLPENSFVITLNETGESFDGVIFDVNNLWRIIFMIDSKASTIRVTQNSFFCFFKTFYKETFKELKEIFSIENQYAQYAYKGSNYFDFFNFEGILQFLNIFEKKIEKYGYVKKTNLEDLTDLLHVQLSGKHYEKAYIVFREFLIEGLIEKIRNLIVYCKTSRYAFYIEFIGLESFLNKFSINSLIFHAMSKLEAVETIISFAIDYFLFSNIGSLIHSSHRKFYLRIIDETNEKIIFEMINRDFTFYMMRVLKKSIVMKRLKKINRIALESADEKETLKILRQNIESLNIEGLNENMYDIITKHGNSFFAYPNKKGLKFMIKKTIPTSLVALTCNEKMVKFLGKSLIGGKIAVKDILLDKIKNNLSTLLKLKKKTFENQVLQNDEKKTIGEDKTKPEMEMLKNSKRSGKIFSEEETDIFNECSFIEKAETENIIKIKKSYRKHSYSNLNQLEMKINIDNTVLIFNDEKIEISKEKVAEDKLKIAKVSFFMILAHEIFNSMRIKFTTNSTRYTNKAPAKMLGETGFFIDKALYGEYIRSANLKPQKITLAISEKVLELEDLTQEEAFSIYTEGKVPKPKKIIFRSDDYDDKDESYEWIYPENILFDS